MAAENGVKTLIALVLQLAALGVLTLSLLGISWLDMRSRPRTLLLVDRSDSVPRTLCDKAIADVTRAVKMAGNGDLQLIEFAGRPAAPSNQPAESAAQLEPSATNVEAALEAALAAHAETAFAGVVVISDGFGNVGDTVRGLRAAREARLPVQWIAVGRPPPRTRIAEVLAPDHVLIGQPIRITVQLAGQLDRMIHVKASARTQDGEIQVASGETRGASQVTLEFDARRSGAVLVDVALQEPDSAQALDAMPDAAVVDVAPRAPILYVQGSTGYLARSLLRGGWVLNMVPAVRLDAYIDSLDGYQAIVLDDVAISDASPRLWSNLASAVRNRGLGLMVLGGERSFARGGYRGSALESVLPVLSEPAALDQPVSIVFAVDKSGSMGQGSGGVDRFAMAQRAVLETARGLSERDSLGLVAFDVAARVLIPLSPAPASTEVLARDWQASPNGGTKLAPALEAAIGELERSGTTRRMLVLVTDGFLDDEPVAGLRARLNRLHIETIALAVGPDADVAALRRLVGGEAGIVLRVDQAAELPFVMRSGLERQRARVERGVIAVEQLQALPFSPGTFKDWPAIAAYSVTRSQPHSTVAVQSKRGDPLIAFQRSGQGHVIVVTGGLGQWNPQWLQWREWSRLAGGLTDWISGAIPGGALALAVSDLPTGLQIEADVQAKTGSSNFDGLSIAVKTPTTQSRLLSTDYVAPGRLRATIPEVSSGLYSFLVSNSLGTREQLHVRRNKAENDTWGVNPALEEWRASGIVSYWEPNFLAQHRDSKRAGRPIDRTLMGLTLVLFLIGILVDRTRPTRAVFTLAQRLRDFYVRLLKRRPTTVVEQ